MINMEKIIKLNTGNGELVAAYLSDFLNARPCCDYKQFCAVMETFSHQGYNFLILSLLWFDELRRVKKPAYNMEASVQLAAAIYEKITAEIEDELVNRMLPAASKDHHNIKVVDSANEIDLARVLVSFLSWGEPDDRCFNAFLDAMCADHGTLQQSFTRLIMIWCRWVDNKYPAESKNRTAILARLICSCDRALPYI